MELPVTLALEEALSNVIRHGCEPNREYDIRVRFAADERAAEIELSDNARPFDPLSLPPPNLDLPIEQRKPGGLGVFLVRQLMDEVTYEFTEGRNRLRFRKSLPPPTRT
jgi:anti-sigma regulatory factor (Ser/Thr protein kinase)